MSKVYRTNGERVRVSTRRERGIALAEERFEEIVKIRAWTWSVPAANGARAYTVNVKHETCSCPDTPPEPEKCKHVYAAECVRSKTAVCENCRNRYRYRDLVEVEEDHDSLSFFAGDHLCVTCAWRSGVAC